MNMFIHELKAYRKSLILWSISLSALGMLYLFMFNGIYSDIGGFRDMIANYPEVIRNAMDINLDTIATLLGFYSFGLSITLVIGAIQAMNFGTSILSKEVREKTADFLLTKPVSREEIVTSKLLAVLTSLAITNVVFIAATSLAAKALSPISFSMGKFIMISATMFFIQLIFMAFGIFVSVVVPKIKSVIPISLGTVFGFYILSAFGSIIGDKAARFISPFKYFDTEYIINNASYEATYVILGIVLVIAGIAASYVIYKKRDIHAV